MSSEDSNNKQFLNEFIDDLYAESDERLALVRRDLLALEPFIEQASVDPNLLDALLRHFHTLKGLLGTINLKEAENLTHQKENYLRAIRDEKVILSSNGMSALLTGTKMLEQAIVAHRTHTSPPALASLIDELNAISSDISFPSPSEPVLDELAATEDKSPPNESGPRTWHFEFIPNAELAERGITVNVIRARLEEIGELLQAMPRLTDSEVGLAFEFLLSTNVDETHFANWQDDGVTYSRHHEERESESGDEEKIAETEIKETEARKEEESSKSVATPSLAPSNMVRVDMARLDELMRMIGELVITRARQENNFKQLQTSLPTSQWRMLQETALMMERQLRDLREGIMRVRLVPIGTVFERMKFVVRDLVNETNKLVKLELSGQHTEIDKLVVDKMIDPLLHLVRNAVSHGIETTDNRIAQGKVAEGQITLRASTVGDAMKIEIEDDGCGIDMQQIAQQAYQQGLMETEETIVEMTHLLDILCQPGFTTQKQANLASGRGIGMDVVKNTVNELGGFISLETELGKGTLFTIQLPLTLAIADALIVAVGKQTFAVPRLSVREVIAVNQAAITLLEDQNEILTHRNYVLPIVRLSHIFDLKEEYTRNCHALIVGNSNKVAIVIDNIIGEQEIVVRALHDPFVQVEGIAGASELGNGSVVLILDVAALIRQSIEKK
jgi:two-component system chemotaxis sensor kinase CheA